jgi:dTDP-4-dehydrorhamnose reductase
MKILITGSNGLLGQKLVELLANDDTVELIATARGEKRLPSSIGEYVYESLDVTDRVQVLNAIDKYKPDAIIHTAAMTNVDQCEFEKEACIKLNVDAVKYLIEAAEAANSFLLHLSTDFIFDGTEGPYSEEAEGNPVSFYGESKLNAEQLLIGSNIKWAIARTVLVYGIAHDMSRSNIILWVKSSLESGKNIQVVNDQWRTPTLAEDLAMGCALIAKKQAEGIFNISGKDMLTPYDMAIKTADFFGLDKGLITETDSSKFTQPAKRPPKTGFIIDKAKNMLGYNPCSFEEGIKILADQVNAKNNTEAIK